MKLSPSSVFWRRIARVSTGTGPYFGSNSISTSVTLPAGGSDSDWTLPTLTPPIRTSDCFASVTASEKDAVKW
jgi:hypothetical protein